MNTRLRWPALSLSAMLAFLLALAGCASPATPPTIAPPASTPAAGIATSPAPTPTPVKTAQATPAKTAQATPLSASTPRYGGELTIGLSSDPVSFDVHQAGSVLAWGTLRPAYNGILRWDPEGKPEVATDLAEKWSISPDGTQYTFNIRKGVKFHDGAPLTAEDVRYTFERLTNPPKGAKSDLQELLTPVKEIKALDDYTLQIATKYRFAPLPGYIADDAAAIYSKPMVERLGDMKTTVNGTGPFKLASYSSSAEIKFVKNKDYFRDKLPYLDAMTFYIIKDNATRLAALRTGRILKTAPWFAALNATEKEQLEKSQAPIKTLESPTKAFVYDIVQMHKPPLEDVRVRRALHLAIDRQQAVKVAFQGGGKVGFHLTYVEVAPGVIAGIPEQELLKMPGFRQPKDNDIAEAKRLLAEAGYPNGLKIEIMSRPMGHFRDASIFLKDQFARIGVDATVAVMDDTVAYARLDRGDFQLRTMQASNSTPDPDILGRFYVTGARYSWHNFNDETFDKLWDEQSRELEPTKRAQLLRKAEERILEVLPTISVGFKLSYVAVANKVRGFYLSVSEYQNNGLETVWLAQ